MFLLAFKGREQRDLSVPGQAAGKGTAAVRAVDPPFLHPRKHPSTQPPFPQERQPGLSQPPPVASLAQPPPTSCPRQERKCAWVAAGWGGVQGEKVTLRVVVAVVATRLRGGLLLRVGGVL